MSGVRWLVPGHGHIGEAAEFRRRVAADSRYLDRLAAGRPFDDPRCNTAEWIRNWHSNQLRAVAGLADGDPGRYPGQATPHPASARRRR